MPIGEALAFHTPADLPSDACHEWQGTINRAGYGQFSTGNRRYTAHRAAYELAHGEIPAGQVVRHTCDNRKCVNSSHLVVGTHAQNVQDAVERKRNSRGERVPTHKLTEDDVRDIRRRYRAGELKAQLARDFGVWQKTIDNVVSGRSWKHVTDLAESPR